MGLDACVCCDCFERRKWRTPPARPEQLYVDEDGFVCTRSKYLGEQIAFDEWVESKMCEHRGGMLCKRRLGNIAAAGVYRAWLGPHANRFPVLIARVLHSGSHAGDRIAASEVAALSAELAAARALALPERYAELVAEFLDSMEDLVRASESVGKPIVFI